MKKLFSFLMLACLFMFASCNSCSTEPEPVVPDVPTVDTMNVDTVEVITVDTITEAKGLTVENVISTDREFIFLNFGTDYRWYESTILMEDWMDGETDGNVIEITNVFQVVTKAEPGYDTEVVLVTTTLDTSYYQVYHTFWLEDLDMNGEQLNLTFEEAFNKVMEANYPKPHSRYCVLRKELGPYLANIQYIFGNKKSQLYCDAVTGNVSPENPVFPKGSFNGPLGEWP